MTIVDLVRRVRHAPAIEGQEWIWGALRRPYRVVLRLVADRGGVARTVNGMPVRLRRPFHEVANDYEAAPFTAFRSLLRPGAVVFDVGASFGLYSIGATRSVGPDGTVFAFEPAQATADLLREHLRLNDARAEVVEMVVTDKAGEQDFWEQSTSLGASLSRAAAEAGRPFTEGEIQRRSVAATTLDAFCADRGVTPDILKIDVEGAEARVLRGAHGLLARQDAVIFLELHPWALEQFGDSQAIVLGLLADAGWSATLLATDGNTEHYICRPEPA